MKLQSIILCSIAVGMTAGIWSDSAEARTRKPPTDNQLKTIILRVDNPTTPNARLVATNSPSQFGCTHAGARNGCVNTTRNYSTDLVFRLTGNTNCGGGDDWEISAFELAGKNVADKANVNWTTALDAEVADDFSADATTGEVDFVALNQGQVRVHNRNERAYSIWYRVRATCGTNRHIYLDPQVRNTGRN